MGPRLPGPSRLSATAAAIVAPYGADDTIACWGNNNYGQTDAPT